MLSRHFSSMLIGVESSTPLSKFLPFVELVPVHLSLCLDSSK